MGISKLPTLRQAWDEYGGWIILLVVIYLLWSFKSLFSSVGDGLGAAVDSATSGVREQAQAKADKVRAVATTPALKKRPPSDAEIARWKADAQTLASYFGTVGGPGVTSVVKGLVQQREAFSLLKLNYARLTLHDNKPFRKNPKTGKYESQTRETPDSVKNPVNWRVLAPFYKEISNGQDLANDIRKYIVGWGFDKALMGWII